MDATQTTLKQVVAKLYDDFDHGELASFDAVDHDFEATVFGTTVLDWPGFIAFGQSFVDAFSDGRHEFDFVVAEGDTVATVGHYRGCHDGELMRRAHAVRAHSPAGSVLCGAAAAPDHRHSRRTRGSVHSSLRRVCSWAGVHPFDGTDRKEGPNPRPRKVHP